MPVPLPAPSSPPLFPSLSEHQVDAARTSSWYHTFENFTVPSTIIDLQELGEEEAFIEVSGKMPFC
jgi:hypothetical protein